MTVLSHTRPRAGVITHVYYLNRPKRYPVCRLTVDTVKGKRRFNVPVLGRYRPHAGQWIYTRGISIDIMFDDPNHLEPTAIPFTRCSAISYIKEG